MLSFSVMNGWMDPAILMALREMIFSWRHGFLAIASHRPYRSSLGIDAALNEISKNKGILYDPEVSDACLRLFQEKDYKFID